MQSNHCCQRRCVSLAQQLCGYSAHLATRVVRTTAQQQQTVCRKPLLFLSQCFGVPQQRKFSKTIFFFVRRFLDMTGFPGGLTAWAPAVLTVLVCSWVAYRGQVGALFWNLFNVRLMSCIYARVVAVGVVSTSRSVPRPHSAVPTPRANPFKLETSRLAAPYWSFFLFVPLFSIAACPPALARVCAPSPTPCRSPVSSIRSACRCPSRPFPQARFVHVTTTRTLFFVLFLRVC